MAGPHSTLSWAAPANTIAGTGVKGFSGDGGSAPGAQISNPSGLVVGTAGQVYFGDIFNQRILVLIPGFRPHYSGALEGGTMPFKRR